MGKFVWPSAFMEETKAMRKRVASDEVIAPLPVSVLKIISPVTPGRLLLQFPKVTLDRNTFLRFNAHLVDGAVYFLSFESRILSYGLKSDMCSLLSFVNTSILDFVPSPA